MSVHLFSKNSVHISSSPRVDSQFIAALNIRETVCVQDIIQLQTAEALSKPAAIAVTRIPSVNPILSICILEWSSLNYRPKTARPMIEA